METNGAHNNFVEQKHTFTKFYIVQLMRYFLYPIFNPLAYWSWSSVASQSCVLL